MLARAASLCAAALVALAGCGTVRSGAPAVFSAADAESIDRLFAAYARPTAPGAAVVVVNRGRVAFMRGYGLAELETRRRVTERTNFRLASLTKSFTAMAVMLLVDEGRVGLDDRARDILPELPEWAGAVRIRHLLTHTSGLPPYQDFVSRRSTRYVTDRDVPALLRRADGLMFPPGSAFRYGDSGYAILTLVVEAVSGQPFTRFLHERILAPLDMTTTMAFAPGGPEVPHRALGYAATRTGFALDDQSTTSTVVGDGGIYSSVRDLVAWDRALDARTLIDARLQHLAWTPATLANGTSTPYGFGWFIDRGPRGLMVFHRGETSGFTNFVLKFPEAGLTVIVLTNRRGGAPGDIAATIAKLPSLGGTGR